jgi:hypothetical protein
MNVAHRQKQKSGWKNRLVMTQNNPDHAQEEIVEREDLTRAMGAVLEEMADDLPRLLKSDSLIREQYFWKTNRIRPIQVDRGFKLSSWAILTRKIFDCIHLARRVSHKALR